MELNNNSNSNSNNYINIGTLTYKHLLDIKTQGVIKLKQKYVKFLCDCIYEDKLEDVQTFKDFCEEHDLEQRLKWENFECIVEDNKHWF